MSPSRKAPSKPQKEKRRAKRQIVFDSFALFVSIPESSPVRQRVLDVNEYGLGLELVDDYLSSGAEFELGRVFDLQIHLNTSLVIPVQAKVIRRIQPSSALPDGSGTRTRDKAQGAKKSGSRGAVSKTMKGGKGPLRIGVEFCWKRAPETDASFRALRALSQLIDALSSGK